MDKIIPTGKVESKILQIRGLKVILDRELAELYGVQTKVLNQAVKRNIRRFPKSFMFQLTIEERDRLVTNCDRFNKLKHSTSMPYAFTEHGALMSANILNSERAVETSILVVEAFVRMRELITSNIEIANKISELESRLDTHDEIIVDIVRSVKRLLDPGANNKKKSKIGFPAK